MKTINRKTLLLSYPFIVICLTILLWPGTDPERTHIVIKQTDSESKLLAQVEATSDQFDSAVGSLLDGS